MTRACAIAWFASGALTLSFTGCEPNYGGRQEVKGTIKLKGEPLDQGQITFIPISGDATTQEGSLIANGAYRIEKQFGLMPGKYKVVITSGDARTPANTDEPPGPTGANIISKDRIPPEYNVRTKQEVEVTDKKPNVFDYDIP